MKAFAEACATKGVLPECTYIGVDDNPASEEARQAVEDALEQR